MPGAVAAINLRLSPNTTMSIPVRCLIAFSNKFSSESITFPLSFFFYSLYPIWKNISIPLGANPQKIRYKGKNSRISPSRTDSPYKASSRKTFRFHCARFLKSTASPIPALADSPATIPAKEIPPRTYICARMTEEEQLGISPTSPQTKGCSHSLADKNAPMFSSPTQ